MAEKYTRWDENTTFATETIFLHVNQRISVQRIPIANVPPTPLSSGERGVSGRTYLIPLPKNGLMQSQPVSAFGTTSSTAPLERMEIRRRELRPHDVEFDILYCGICHSDLHSIHNDWGGTTYPIVPGHDILGRVTTVGAEVTVFTRSVAKAEDAHRLGADHVVLSKDTEQMAASLKQDFILDTVSGQHDVNVYLQLLQIDGALVLVGLPAEPLQVASFNLVTGCHSFSGSNIGGIAETQKMLYFCYEYGITAESEIITVDQINDSLVRLERGDVKYRLVIDMSIL